MEQSFKLRILDETVEYYKTNPRGVDPKKQRGCHYYKNGAVCAVGRLSKEPFVIEDASENGDVFDSDIESIYESFDSDDEFWELLNLKDEYKDLETENDYIDFLSELQSFHDGVTYWKRNKLGGNDLTKSGEEQLRRLKDKWVK
jgi:hypothetical protein